MAGNEKHIKADFETAITETQFGLFNFFILLITITSILFAQYEISALAFVFPAAKCDLNLSLEDRGLINAITYIGMIGSCFMWGSLADVFGRRKILIISHLSDCIFILMTVFSSNFYMLITAKFCGGFIINGATMALTPYLSEFHNAHFRSRIPLIIGLLYNFGNVIIPLIAWSILTLPIHLPITENFELHSWNMFLLLAIIPALLGGFAFWIMPESPKYLISEGKNEKALEIFQKIYAINTKRKRTEYPVEVLADCQQIYRKESNIREAWKQISPLFSAKYAKKLILICVLQLFFMMCFNSFRLWLPEIFQLINDYELGNSTKSISFCSVLSNINQPRDHHNDITSCSVNVDNSSVYIKSSIVGIVAILGYIAASITVNKIGKKRMLLSLSTISGLAVISIYFTQNMILSLCLTCLHFTCLGVCIDLVITYAVDMFPTHLRASALSLCLMVGRIGSVLGNLILPILLQFDCSAVLFTLGGIILGCAIFAILLPNTNLKALE